MVTRVASGNISQSSMQEGTMLNVLTGENARAAHLPFQMKERDHATSYYYIRICALLSQHQFVNVSVCKFQILRLGGTKLLALKLNYRTTSIV